MARPINRLSSASVKALKAVGRHPDGGGLYLRITPQGAKAWSFMTTTAGVRREIGLGAASAVSLASARSVAQGMREAVALGLDPKTVITPPEPEIKKTAVTFGEFADEHITTIEKGWKNPVHRQQWRQSLRDHAANLRDLVIDQISTEHVLEALRPIWMTKPETAKRVRGRIEHLLDAAKARGLRPVDCSNPARLRGHLALLLPTQNKLVRGHHAALDWKTAPTFMSALRHRAALSARALEFTILTAARSGETLGATWAEIDLEAATWTVAPERMKAGAEHVVPLSSAAVELLRRLRPSDAEPSDVVFAVGGTPRSNMAMAQLLKRMDYGHITTHGFRSTFRDWAGDETQFPRELIEQALAHTITNKAERAYRRGTAIEKRRALMEEWAAYLNTASAGA